LYDMVLAMYDLIGVDGLSFTNGEDVVDWLDDLERGHWASEDIPELVLLDIRLPGAIGGDEVGRRLRANPQTRDIAMILMTAYKLTNEQQQEVMRISQADLFIYKPLPPIEKLTSIMEDLLVTRNQTRNRPPLSPSQ